MTSPLFEKLRKVRERFCAALPEALEDITGALDDGTAQGTARAHRRLHELCGTAGMIGEKELARCLDPALRMAETAAAQDRCLSTEERDKIAALIDTARRLAAPDAIPVAVADDACAPPQQVTPGSG